MHFLPSLFSLSFSLSSITPPFPLLRRHRRLKPPPISRSTIWMADCMNQGNRKKMTHLTIKTNASSPFNRSAAGEEEDKPASRPQPGASFKGKVKKLCSIFESPRHNESSTFDPDYSPSLSPLNSPVLEDFSSVRLPGTEDRVVIYFTSLRGIRRTFQDCHRVRMIFRGFRVNVDERDISMDAAYKYEMQEVFGGKVSLPQVFIKGNHIGGAELVMNLVEEGELVRMLKGLPLRSLKPCDVCGDLRFIPCVNCGGSRKVFDDEREQINRCPVCNENGLMRCPICCS